MLRIDYHAFNNIVLREDNMHILDYNIEERMLKRWGILQLEPLNNGHFAYDVVFVSDKHESMFQLQYGDRI